MRTLFLLCLVAASSACQSGNTARLSADNTGTTAFNATASTDLTTQRDKFLSNPELSERIQRLLELEQQALQLAVDEPLKLGSIGSAILAIYPGSQTGHYAMSRFYDHVESADAQAKHDAELARLQAAMQDSGTGKRESAFKVLTIYDAHTYAKTEGASPVGSIYQSTDLTPFGFLLVVRPQNGPLQQMFFDISHVLKDFRERVDESTAVSGGDQISNPWAFMRLLASRMDTAAQTAIGRYLASVEKYDDAISWLRVASRSGNVLANSMLARIYWTQAEASDSDSERDELRERSLENHLHAIALGSTDSMYLLANLYINDYFGEENRVAALPLLRQAGDLDHAESLLYLAHLYNIGREVEQSAAQATTYFERAAALNNPQAILSYGRFLAGLETDTATSKDNRQVHTWLEGLASDNNAEAMVVLGNLHARGVGTRASTSRAVRWYKRAINKAPDNADIVNEVAWTLTVSDLKGLKRARYAKRIMDNLMTDEAMRTRPEYLDTWAAAHAASGDFTKAVNLQQEAINVATSQDREDVLDILKVHLEQFKAGATITEKAP